MTITADTVPETTDAELARRSVHDPDTFGLLFERHFPDIHRYAERRLGTVIADDVAAETFLIAFRERAKFVAERGSLRGWLFGICANVLGRHRRTEVQNWRTWSRLGVDPVGDHAPQVAEQVDAGAHRQRLAKVPRTGNGQACMRKVTTPPASFDCLHV